MDELCKLQHLDANEHKQMMIYLPSLNHGPHSLHVLQYFCFLALSFLGPEDVWPVLFGCLESACASGCNWHSCKELRLEA